MRHAANLESVLSYESTSEVHQLVISQTLTGHAEFRQTRPPGPPMVSL